jgi:hypothetical protein
MEIAHQLNRILFSWNSQKNQANYDKHGVEFETACQAFFDPFLKIVDVDSDSGEAREALIGLADRWEMLYVVFVERSDTFRIVSARPATRSERRIYEEE